MTTPQQQIIDIDALMTSAAAPMFSRDSPLCSVMSLQLTVRSAAIIASKPRVWRPMKA